MRTVTARGGRANLERLLKLVEYGRLAPERIVTHIYHGLDKVEEALKQMGGNDRTAIKPVVFVD
ncbi:MAG: hypothetical protein LBU38_02510 [Propionibacteriaceae bacterium]|nr:hypothetical protein [Propionibacteriaceae bacterium]